MNQSSYNWAAEVMAYAMAHPAGVARRKTPKASRPVRSAPAAVQAPTVEPVPEPMAVEQPQAEPVAVEAEPVSRVVQLRPAGPFSPQDLAAAVECLRLIDREAEDATEYFLGHLPEFYALGVTVAKPDYQAPSFEHFVADIHAKMVEFPTASHFRRALSEIVTAGREYQATHKAGAGEAELAAVCSEVLGGIVSNVERFARAMAAIPSGNMVGFYSAGSDFPVNISAKKLKSILAVRARWQSYSVEFSADRVTVKWANKWGGRGQMALTSQPGDSTTAVTVGRANDNAVAA
jgi:hypothetical protein